MSGFAAVPIQSSTGKREEHEMAMASKEASNDWPFSQMLKGSIRKENTHQQSLMRSTYPRANSGPVAGLCRQLRHHLGSISLPDSPRHSLNEGAEEAWKLTIQRVTRT